MSLKYKEILLLQNTRPSLYTEDRNNDLYSDRVRVCSPQLSPSILLYQLRIPFWLIRGIPSTGMRFRSHRGCKSTFLHLQPLSTVIHECQTLRTWHPRKPCMTCTSCIIAFRHVTADKRNYRKLAYFYFSNCVSSPSKHFLSAATSVSQMATIISGSTIIWAFRKEYCDHICLLFFGMINFVSLSQYCKEACLTMSYLSPASLHHCDTVGRTAGVCLFHISDC